MAARDVQAAIVIADKDTVATKLIEFTCLDEAVFRTVKIERASAIDCPVTAQERLACLHEGPQTMPKREISQADPLHGRLLGAAHLHQVLQAHDFHDGVFQIYPCWR